MTAAVALSVANVAAIKALQAGTLGVGLSGGGFTVYYILGVVDALIKLGIIVPAQTKVAGASAGALATTAVCSGLDGAALKDRALSLAYACQRPGNCAGILDDQVKAMLDRTVSKDGYKKCSDRGYLSITTGDLFNQKNMIVGSYSSNDDLKAAAAASAYVPFFSGSDTTTTFRGQTAADGGMTNNLPCPPGVAYCLKVSITPYGFAQPSTSDTLQNLLDAQNDDGSNRFNPKLPPVPATPKYDEKRIAVAAAGGIDIQPNVYNPFPFSPEDWDKMKFRPAGNETLNYLLQLGYADAMAWAQRNGMAGAAAAKNQMNKPAAAAPVENKAVAPKKP